jgi:hypothetical protein
MGIDADPNPLPGALARRVGSTQVMSRSIFMLMRDAVGEITKPGTDAEAGVRGELITLVPPLTLVCGEPLVVAEMALCEPFPTG